MNKLIYSDHLYYAQNILNFKFKKIQKKTRNTKISKRSFTIARALLRFTRLRLVVQYHLTLFIWLCSDNIGVGQPLLAVI